MKVALGTFMVLAGGVALLLVLGRLRWRAYTKKWRTQLDAARRPVIATAATAATAFTTHDLDGLPAPVQRYLRAALKEGKNPVKAVDLNQAGTINMSETAEQWKPFTARQRVETHRPGFIWDARIAMMPGVPVFVQDAYVGGEGVLRASVGGLVQKADLRERGELARGELMRFLAEAAWYPTVLIPGQGVVWSPVDDHSAQATLRDGDLSVTLRFHFDSEDMIDTVRAEARGRGVGAGAVAMPWQCRLWNYATRDGMLVPLQGEAAWITPTGTKTYWRGKITKMCYEFAL